MKEENKDFMETPTKEMRRAREVLFVYTINEFAADS